jgi:response regulator RpfG family c-di-GMP phosphodiesterase
MRRCHPKCINFILTGFPAFESALQALRSQVDDYFTKPSNIPMLVASIERHLKSHQEPKVYPAKRLADLLRSNIEEVKARTLAAMREHPELATLPLSDEELVEDLDPMIKGLAEHIASGRPNEGSELLQRFGRERAELRRRQHCPMELMVDCHRLTVQVINNVVYENLLTIDLSYLLLDLGRLNDAIMLQLGESIRAYNRFERSA